MLSIVASTPASVSLIGRALSKITPTTADAAVAIATPPRTAKAPPFGSIAMYAKILPGDGGPTRPAPVATNQRSAEIQPAHIAMIIIG